MHLSEIVLVLPSSEFCNESKNSDFFYLNVIGYVESFYMEIHQ